MRRLFYLLLLVSLTSVYSIAQSASQVGQSKNSPYNFKGDDTVTVNGTLKFYDDGGPTGNHTRNTKGAVTFVPQSGQAIKLVFNSFNTRSDFSVYDGYSTEIENLVATFKNELTVLPTIVSISNDGAITVEFRPSMAGAPGWDIDVISLNPAPIVISSVSSQVLASEPVLKGSENQQMVRVDVDVTGDRGNINLTELKFSAANSTSIGDISRAVLYHTDTVSTFSLLNQHGVANINPDGSVTFNSSRVFKRAGVYKFWLTYDIAQTATTSNIVKGKLLSVKDQTTTYTQSDNIEASRAIRGGFSGSYTIGNSSTADYSTFTAAISAMSSQGIEGPVVFTVESGLYNQAVSIPHIEGASSVNTITFKSENSDYNNVTIQTNYSQPIFAIKGADHITIDGISFKTTSPSKREIVLITDISRHVTIKNCLIEAPRSTGIANSIELICTKASNTMHHNNDYLTVENCQLKGGRIGVKCDGTGYVALPKQKGGRIVGNTFSEQGYMAIYMTKEHDGIIENNTIAVTGTVDNGYKAIDAVMMGNTIIRNNKISIDSTTTKYAYAIYLRGRDANETLAGRNHIYNNQIIYNRTVKNSEAIFCADKLTNVDIVYNSVNITNKTSIETSSAVSMSGNNLKVLKSVFIANNIFQNHANGCVYKFKSNIDLDQVTFQNNVCYTSSASTFSSHGTNSSTFAEWQSEGRDQNSIFTQVNFQSSTNLNVGNATNLNIALPLDYVTTDINNTPRSTTTPTAGCYEIAAQTTPPAFADNYPEIFNIQYSSAKAKVKLTEDGKLFFLARATSSAQPQVNEILAADSITLTKNIESQVTFEGLTPVTACKAYFVIKGEGGYQSSIIESSEFTTTFRPTEVSTFETVSTSETNFTDATADFSGFTVEAITDGVGSNNHKAAKKVADTASVTINNHSTGLILNGFNFKSDAAITLKALRLSTEAGTMTLQPTNGKWVFISLKHFNELTSIKLIGSGTTYIDNFSGTPQPLAVTLNDTTVNENTVLTLQSTIVGGVLPYSYAWLDQLNDTLSTDATMTMTAKNTTAIRFTVIDGWNDTVSVKAVVRVLGNSTVATFDDLYLAPESFWMGDPTSANFYSTFYSGSYSFRNMYMQSINTWGGFGYSNTTSTTFAPSSFLTDQFNSSVGHGFDGTANYSVVYTLGAPVNVTVEHSQTGDTISGFYITNTAWVKYVSEHGTGMNSQGQNDANTPFTTGDWYKITAKGDNNKTVDFYLADYRSDNSANHYTLDTWQWFDLSSLGNVKKVTFSSSGTRANAWGSTIPFYFCMDNFGGELQINVIDTVRLYTGENTTLNLNTLASENIVAGADIQYFIVDSANNTITTTLTDNTLTVEGQNAGTTDMLIRQTIKGKSTYIKLHVVTEAAIALNTNNRIELKVKENTDISYGIKASVNGSTIRIESGTSSTTMTAQSDRWLNGNFTAQGTTITFIGDIAEFECNENGIKIDTIDASNHSVLATLKCHNNSLVSLNVQNSNALHQISCYNNNLTACALDKLFMSLPTRQIEDSARIYIKDTTASNPGASGCQTPIATLKNWKVMDFNGGEPTEINITNPEDFACGANLSRYIALVTQDGAQLSIALKADNNETPVLIKSGANTVDAYIGSDWSDTQIYTAHSDTLFIYGNISGVKSLDNNQVTDIDITSNNQLQYLYCTGNQLTSLDVSNNSSLLELNCSNNTNLTSINVEGCTSLARIYCSGNQLDTLDVSNSTALTHLYCYQNQLTMLNVDNCPQLKTISCYANQLDACTLDQIFRSLATREINENARFFIKNDTETNPGTEGCRIPIATNKRWKVMDLNGNIELNNGIFTCPNIERYIYIAVQNGAQINLGIGTTNPNTPIRIINGGNIIDKIIGTAMTAENLTAAGDTITIYGDIAKFDCSGNGAHLTGVDISNNMALTRLNCSNNGLNSLYIGKDSELRHLHCYGNNLDACAMDLLFRSLPLRKNSDFAKIFIKNESSTNPGTETCRTPIANAKNWKVLDQNNQNAIEINNSTFTCPDIENYISMSVQTGQTLALRVKASEDNSLVRIINGNNSTDTIVGTEWHTLQSITTASSTIIVYGNIIGFDCSENSTKLTALDLKNNTILTELYCRNNLFTSIDLANNTALTTIDLSGNNFETFDVSPNTAITEIYLSGNNINSCALDALFNTLPERQPTDSAKVYIKDGAETNPGADGCHTPTANAKNWKVMDRNSGTPTEIINTIFSCLANMDNSITMKVIEGTPVYLGVTPAEENTLVQIVSGANVTDTIISSYCEMLFTPASDTIMLHGNITTLYCADNEAVIKALDISANQILTAINCGGNMISSLNIGNKPHLTNLACYGNQLTTLDLSNAPALTELYCDNNQLTTLNLSNNTNLIRLRCSMNQIAEINLSNNADLIELNCYNNQLTTLDLTNNNELTRISCGDNQLTTLDLSNAPALTELYCDNNQLTTLDLSNKISLKELNCSVNELTELILTNTPVLEIMYCYANNLDACALDDLFDSLPQRNVGDDAKIFIKQGALTNPGADGCQTPIANAKNWKVMDFNLGEINNTVFTCQPGAERLITLTVQSGEQIDISVKAGAANTPVRIVGGTNITDTVIGVEWINFANIATTNDTIVVVGEVKGFDCSANGAKITTLDVSANNTMTALKCADNQLTALNVNNNTSLKELICNNNQLSTINISNNSLLNKLDCSNNQLTTLNLETNAMLKELNCSNNQITELQLFYNNKLIKVDCSNNQLTQLGMRELRALTEVNCANNNITNMTLSDNTALKLLYCQGNQITACTLDMLLSELPERQPADSAMIFIKDGVETNPGTDGCQTPIANAKNWRVMDKNGGNHSEIINTEFTCIPNMSRYITMIVQNGSEIYLDFKADEDNTPVSIVSGSSTTITTTGTNWTGMNSYIAEADTITVFGNIVGFDCSDNEDNITALNASANNTLTELNCSNNQLTALNISNNTALTELICNNNQLTTLDVSNNTALESLLCSNNQLTALDVSNSTALESLLCSNNQLTTLDVSNSTALESLLCSNNQLTTLDVSNNTALTYLDCGYNQLTTLDVSNSTALESLLCNNNQLTTLDVSSNTALTELICNNNQLTALDVTNNTALTELSCYANQLDACALDQLFRTLTQRQASDNARVFIKNGTETNPGADGCQTPIANAKNWRVMDANGNVEINNTTFTCPNMERYITMTVQNGEKIKLELVAATDNTPVLIVSGNNVETVMLGTEWTTVQNFTAAADTIRVYGNVTGFDCSDNQTKLTGLNLSNNTTLTHLACYNNRLTTLDISSNTALTHFSCSENQITTLNVSANNNLIVLDCSKNLLSELNVSNNTDLTGLICSENQIATLVLSSSNTLGLLDCSNNQLTQLNIGNNTSLTALYCAGNNISELDFSNNPILIHINCSNNQLKTLDASKNIALTTLICSGNNLSDCALDSLFRSLPQRQANNEAKVYIKDGVSTNPGTDGCRTPIANAKNWKVMDNNGGNEIEINNTIFTCQEVSIDDILTEHEIKLYPNPVNSELYIEADAEVRIIQVFNMNGVEVARKFESNRIDLNHLQPNTYIVRITTDRNSSNQFVIKQ